ncbi:hypothetical protein PsorP6_011123 [Peronosclerospora sorghi]|uniref:Uncharacterized protein n=1 Tax=Peronosclerospora sorghi TaxID=230839 RepID=A0ACC0VYR5_9STRA|nr:hypothetical protein PsorP6_011123 [Peronosclerospora sorghi]
MAMTMTMKSITGDAHFFEETMNLDRIRKLLDNKLGVAGHSEKLEAMKALLASISKGDDVSTFFADVVKNVIVANVEVKKLVYMYLVHYADANAQCRELALLSINSFQKDLADPNPLIRALALRVMTSIRVRDILQIQLIAIRKCAADESAYVRKCATNAISKVFVVDPDQEHVLAEILATLLNDASTMVLGSAVQALSEVCPDRMDLLHRPFRKLCHLLADIDEWGQTVTLQLLTRYCRTQFQNGASRPGRDKHTGTSPTRTTRAFYSDEEDHDSSHDDEDDDETKGFLLRHSARRDARSPFLLRGGRKRNEAPATSAGDELDDDHRLVLRSSIPLLKSRNSAVVLAVATLHYYCGTHSMATSTLIAKSLVRIMRNQREIQYVVLSVIASMATSDPDIFRPFLHDFFVRAADPAYARKLKLEILTSLVTNDNVTIILSEFQAYVRHVDKSFVTMTVRALGRVADAMPSVAPRCLNGLLRLVRSSSDQVVAESVVVIRQLLQQHQAIETDRLGLVRSLAAMMVAGRVTSPMARASIVWMLGEFQDHDNGTTCAAESLRLMVKNFSEEATDVRLQLMNLAVKLGLREPQSRPIQLLLQYVLELCKFDLDYDIRDRARLVRAALAGDANVVSAHNLFARAKPAPWIGYEHEKTTREFILGTLSNLVRHSVPGYTPLPAWRTSQPDRSVRDECSFVETNRRDVASRGDARRGKKTKDKRKHDAERFYSDASSRASASESESTSESNESSDDESQASSSDNRSSDSHSRSSSSGVESEEEDASESDASMDKQHRRHQSRKSKTKTKTKATTAKAVNAFDPLDLLGSPPGSMSSTSQAVGTSTGPSSSLLGELMSLTLSSSSTLPPRRHELLSSETGSGFNVHYAFLRPGSSEASTRHVIQLWLANHSTEPIADIQIRGKHPDDVIPFPTPLAVLFPGGSTSMAQVHVDFHGRLDPVPLAIVTSRDTYDVELAPTIGELLVPLQLTVDDFDRGLSLLESTCLHTSDVVFPAPVDMNTIVHAVLQAFHVAPIYEINTMNRVVGKSKFAAQFRSGTANADTVLIGVEIQLASGKGRVVVGMRDAVLAQHVLTAVKQVHRA